MKRKIALLVVGLLLLALVLALAACNGEEPQQTAEPCPTCAPAEAGECPECPECPAPEACPTQEACPDCPECPEGGTVADACPFGDQWAGSGHADAEAEAFVHWDEDDPAEVPPSCASCHSSPGYQDYLGADGSEMWVVDQPAPIGTVVDCQVCHNEAAISTQ
ncbi:MAG: hypothetical protein M8467_17040, partial [Anaerolineae bacterium]|nr:hypothetical protein [Anaerolineae bacterium]